MSMDPEVRQFRRVLRDELQAIQSRWVWLVALGIILIVLGVLAISAPMIASLATALTIGVILLLAGIADLVGAFWTRNWTGFLLMLMIGVLHVVVGLLLIRQPGEGILALTLLLASLLMVSGLFRILASLAYRFPNWGWVLLGGVINLLLGFLIWQEWPVSGFWVIGLFVGIEMIYNGWIWVLLGLALKRLTVEPPTVVAVV
jgi:uncharacterized membrane protein HdeD (DUF308 family)